MATEQITAPACTKCPSRSRTLWFNAIVAALVAVELSLNLLEPHVAPKVYLVVTFVVTIVNAVLRVITTQPLGRQVDE